MVVHGVVNLKCQMVIMIKRKFLRKEELFLMFKKGKKMIKKIKMYIKIVLSFLMVFTLLSSSSNHVYAKNSQNKDNFPLKGVVKYNGKISYGGNIVGDFTVNGKQVFCMEHPVTTPPTGTELTIDIYENDNIRKVLYYGWGGYEQWSGFKSREHGIVVTSLMLSYYYYGDNSSPNTINEFK